MGSRGGAKLSPDDIEVLAAELAVKIWNGLPNREDSGIGVKTSKETAIEIANCFFKHTNLSHYSKEVILESAFNKLCHEKGNWFNTSGVKNLKEFCESVKSGLCVNHLEFNPGSYIHHHTLKQEPAKRHPPKNTHRNHHS